MTPAGPTLPALGRIALALLLLAGAWLVLAELAERLHRLRRRGR